MNVPFLHIFILHDSQGSHPLIDLRSDWRDSASGRHARRTLPRQCAAVTFTKPHNSHH